MMKGAVYALMASTTVHLVEGHGYLTTPRSRNWVAHEDINSCNQAGGSDCPPPEYCYHCLNNSDGVCGKTNTNSYENDVWLDRSGVKMSFQPQVGGVGFTLQRVEVSPSNTRASPRNRRRTRLVRRLP